MTTLFVYGSLKRGFFNHNRFGFDKAARFIGEGTAEGVGMVRLGRMPYPHAYHAPGMRIAGELYKLHNKRVEEAIEQMEIGAGYKPIEVQVGEHTAKIYVADDNTARYIHQQIEEGKAEALVEWREG
jgi:gamma-glutamylcyclotransferase (GGCT)/AIG2-like uncharacterized protein YtfP